MEATKRTWIRECEDKADLPSGPPRESKRKLSPIRLVDKAQLEKSIQRIGPRLTTEMQPSMSLSRSLSEPKFILTRAASAQAILKPNSVKGKKRIAHARASQFSQAGAIEASGIKASPVELSKGVAGQEWLGEEINNEPFKSRNASSRQNDAVGKGGQSAWRSEWW